ncbi:rod shape-determining protein RodA [uncultured Dokdonia sp.]|uniref:rod shape-determining protein RodA n=1 Tax=uncultured Dokdonia sp. TaxID=575653 RepID=UPI002630E743|nr:rod shape-determining protein RodA [uncultured Dokdonia sp.]
MSTGSRSVGSFDWALILIYLALISIGWLSIYSASYNPEIENFFSLENLHFKQLIWIGLGFIIITFILFLDSKFFERFSSLIYVVAILSLLLLFPLGKNINGATSWFAFGSFTLQPSEFAKVATALALAKYLSDIQTNIKTLRDQLRAFLIIAIPALVIIPQPDPGSALVYAAFFFPLYREGIAAVYLILGASVVTLFVLTLLFGPLYIALGVVGIAILFFLKNRKRRPSKMLYLGIILSCTLFSFSVNYIFENVFQQRHRDRFNIVLGKEVDTQSIGYNTRQSEIAIGNGGWTGQGFLQGTQTTGKFVPEQDTDYIFSAVGEEWGFMGSGLVVVLFVLLILRIIQLSEKQKNEFSRIYGYSVAGILFIHFAVNVGMVTGLLPTIGIPLPFFSYGGSGFWGFTILLFIFIKLDGNRVNEW